MVELIIGILGIIVIAMGYVIWNLSHKNKIYEDELGDIDEVISAVSEDIKNAYDRLVSIDRLGSFQADDETGYVFQEMKEAIEVLNEWFDLNDTTEENKKETIEKE